MDPRRYYDYRRLILAPQACSTGLWHPRLGEQNAKAELNNFGELSCVRDMVQHESLDLPPELSKKITQWINACNSAKRTKSSIYKFSSSKEVLKENQRQQWTDGRLIAEELATFFGARKQVEYQGCVVLPSKLAQLCSKAFVYGSEYAERRNRQDFRSVLAHRTYLSYLLREEMDDEMRKVLFPTPFHLGSKRTIAFADLSWTKLASALSGQNVSGIEAKDQFKQIRKTLLKIIEYETIKPEKDTAYPRLRYEFSKVLKVIGLLYQLAQSREIDGKTPQIMNMLKPPTDGGEFSFSFRSAYPFNDARKRSCLIGDLKAHLGAELPERRFRKITRWYAGLIPFVDGLMAHVEAEINGKKHNLDGAVGAYGAIIKAISSYTFEAKRGRLSLDEDLYRHIHFLEFAHFVVGYPQLIKVARKICPTTPIESELDAFLEEVEDANVGIHTPFISVNGIQAFAKRHQQAIVRIMEAAIGHNWVGRAEPKVKRHQWPGKRSNPVQMSQRDYDRLTDVSQKLLHMICWMHSGEETRDDANVPQITPLQVVAAFCCVWHTVDDATHYAPKWQGSGTQGGKLSESFEKPIFSEEDGIDVMPMEHRHLLSLRTDWFAHALVEQEPLIEIKISFRTVLLKMVREICASNSIAAASNELRKFQHAVLRAVDAL